MPETTSSTREDVLIVQLLKQKILSDALCAQIGEEFLQHADDCNGKLLLDFSGVTFMSSGLITGIVTLNKKAKRDKITLKFCCVHPAIMEVFEITRLNKVFRIYLSQDDAMNAFSRGHRY